MPPNLKKINLVNKEVEQPKKKEKLTPSSHSVGINVKHS